MHVPLWAFTQKNKQPETFLPRHLLPDCKLPKYIKIILLTGKLSVVRSNRKDSLAIDKMVHLKGRRYASTQKINSPQLAALVPKSVVLTACGITLCKHTNFTEKTWQLDR
jgi:hypothetical protein